MVNCADSKMKTFVKNKRIMENNIKGKVVIITGASSGIGLATAKILAAKGASIVLGARSIDKLKALVGEIRTEGGSAIAVQTDVSKKEDVDRLIAAAITEFGTVDVLFNNAGIMPLAMMESLKYDEWEALIDVNIKGVLYGVGAVIPIFKEKKSGHIINVSSTAGYSVYPTSTVYSATKFAVRAITEGLRQELTPYNIRTTVISPGLTQSNLTESINESQLKDAVKGMMAIAMPAESIARAVVFALEQPNEVDVNEMIIRPVAQS